MKKILFDFYRFQKGILISISGLFGLPWMCAAPVRSLAHVASLSKYSNTHAPGEKARLIEIKDQRLTNIGVHVLIGCTIFAASIIRKIPVAAVFGIFLYFGIVSISGTQLFSRLKMTFIPTKYHPNFGYLRRVKFFFDLQNKNNFVFSLLSKKGPSIETKFVYIYSINCCDFINHIENDKVRVSFSVYSSSTRTFSKMVSSISIYGTWINWSKTKNSSYSNISQVNNSFFLLVGWRRRTRKYFWWRNRFLWSSSFADLVTGV